MNQHLSVFLFLLGVSFLTPTRFDMRSNQPWLPLLVAGISGFASTGLFFYSFFIYTWWMVLVYLVPSVLCGVVINGILPRHIFVNVAIGTVILYFVMR
jgi:hypothetical protein